MSDVVMRHPDLDDTITVQESAVQHWVRSGWQVVDPVESDEKKNLRGRRAN